MDGILYDIVHLGYCISYFIIFSCFHILYHVFHCFYIQFQRKVKEYLGESTFDNKIVDYDLEKSCGQISSIGRQIVLIFCNVHRNILNVDAFDIMVDRSRLYVGFDDQLITNVILLSFAFYNCAKKNDFQVYQFMSTVYGY